MTNIKDVCWFYPIGKCEGIKKGWCKDSCEKYWTFRQLLKLSELPENRWKYMEFINNRRGTERLIEIKDDIKNFVQSGKNLYIWSVECGTHKTVSAINLMFVYLYKIWRSSKIECKALFINVPRFITDYKNKNLVAYQKERYERLLQKIEKADVVVWDDLCTSSLTEYDIKFINALMSGRALEGKSNIITSNKNHNELKDIFGLQFAQRFTNEIINMDWA